MKFKKELLFICIVLLLFGIATVNAEDLNNTELTINDDFQQLEESNDETINLPQENLLGDDDGTFTAFQKKIDDAPDGSIITLDKDYTYDEGFGINGIQIGKDITINGNGHSFNGLSKSRIFLIEIGLLKNNNVVLNNIKFQNGYTDYYGGAIFNFGNLTINNCKFENNYAKCCGGAINSVGKLNCKNSVFNRNTAKGDGGAILCLSFDGSIDFYENYYKDKTIIGDMEFILPISVDASIKFGEDYITGCTFTNNVAKGRGGGAVYAFSNLDVNSCNFKSNTAGELGGAIFGNKDLYVKNSVFTENQARKYGGGIYFKCHEITSNYNNGKWVSGVAYFTGLFESSTFVKNSAGKGGAIYGFVTSLSDTNFWSEAIKCTFEDNSAPSYRDTYGVITSKCTYKYLGLTLKTVKVKKSAKKLVLTATLKHGTTPLKAKKITFKFKGKKYIAKTNAKGIAKVTIKKNVLNKLKVGKKVKYQASYEKITVKKTAKVKK